MHKSSKYKDKKINRMKTLPEGNEGSDISIIQNRHKDKKY